MPDHRALVNENIEDLVDFDKENTIPINDDEHEESGIDDSVLLDDDESEGSEIENISVLNDILEDLSFDFKGFDGEYSPYFPNFMSAMIFIWITKHMICK